MDPQVVTPFVKTLSSAQASALARLRRRPGGRSPRSQLVDMQNVLMAEVLNPATKAADKAACARAFEVLEERIRILNGKPLPGQLRPDGNGKPQPKRLPMFRSLEAIDVTPQPEPVTPPREPTIPPAGGPLTPPPEGP